MEKELELSNYNISRKTGFLPEQSTQILQDDYFCDWEKAAQNVPQLIRDQCLVRAISQLPEREFSEKTLHTESEWQRAYVIVSFLAQAYISEMKSISGVAAINLHKKLAIPWQNTAEYIGVPPVATYAAVVLYNYVLKDPNGTINPNNLHSAVSFTGSQDESWFYMVHVLEELAAAPGLEAITEAYKAIKSNDKEALGKNLKVVTESIHTMKVTLAKMYDHCTPNYFYFTLRPFLSLPDNGVIYDEVSPDIKNYRSGSGAQDSAIPAFSIFLGIKHGQEEQEMLDDFKIYMPAKHREFLNILSQQPSVRDYVQESNDAELIRCFEDAVGALETFRSEHIKLVSSYIISAKQRHGVETTEEDKGTGGAPIIRFLKNLRDNTNTKDDVHK